MGFTPNPATVEAQTGAIGHRVEVVAPTRIAGGVRERHASQSLRDTRLPIGGSRKHSTRLSWTQGRRVARPLPKAHNRQRPAVVHRRLVTLQRVELQRRIAEGAGAKFLLFALTPPRLTTKPEQASQIAAKTLERLRSVGLDGLVLYDIDEESDRNPEERPFPFLPTMEPADYLARDLAGLEVPAIVYRAVSKYPEHDLRAWLSERVRPSPVSLRRRVLPREVGSHLARCEPRTQDRGAPDLLLGGVAIPERHTRGGREHLRLLAKQAAGCSFFVTQIIYDADAAKDLVRTITTSVSPAAQASTDRVHVLGLRFGEDIGVRSVARCRRAALDRE